MCLSFPNISDVRGKDCTQQVKFFCLRILASSEIYCGINILWTQEDHSSQDTAQPYNVKIRRFSSCRVADVPWTSPVWQADARSAWPYGQSRECTPPSAAAPWLWLVLRCTCRMFPIYHRPYIMAHGSLVRTSDGRWCSPRKIPHYCFSQIHTVVFHWIQMKCCS